MFEGNFEQIVIFLNLLGVQFDGDNLYEEFGSFKEIRIALNEEDNQTPLKWDIFFKQCRSPELLKLLKCVLSIPISNAAVERRFSIMLNLWTDEKAVYQ
jgi:hypothetical protein